MRAKSTLWDRFYKTRSSRLYRLIMTVGVAISIERTAAADRSTTNSYVHAASQQQLVIKKFSSAIIVLRIMLGAKQANERERTKLAFFVPLF